MEVTEFKRTNYITQTEACKAHKLPIKTFKSIVEGLTSIDRNQRDMGGYTVDIKYYLKDEFLKALDEHRNIIQDNSKIS